MDKYTQCKRILDHLAACGQIERGTAFNVLHIANLTARVADLRKQGYPVVKEMR